MRVEIQVTIQEGLYRSYDNDMQKSASVEVEDALTLECLPWDMVCANLVEGALAEWRAKQEADEPEANDVPS